MAICCIQALIRWALFVVLSGATREATVSEFGCEHWSGIPRLLVPMDGHTLDYLQACKAKMAIITTELGGFRLSVHRDWTRDQHRSNVHLASNSHYSIIIPVSSKCLAAFLAHCLPGTMIIRMRAPVRLSLLLQRCKLHCALLLPQMSMIPSQRTLALGAHRGDAACHLKHYYGGPASIYHSNAPAVAASMPVRACGRAQHCQLAPSAALCLAPDSLPPILLLLTLPL